MTISPLVEPIYISPEIIFPEGDFWSDEPPLETYLHLQQIILLMKSLEWFWREREDFFAAGNLTIYYSPRQKKSEHFRRPDFFVVLGTERRLDRKSWVAWEEGGRYPDVIVEILSDSTAKTDRGEKKQIYQDIFRTSDYFWFEPVTLEFQGFRLVDGQYQPIEPNEQGWLWSDRLELYLGIYEQKLRYFKSSGELVPIVEEVVQEAEQKAQEAEQKAQEAEQKAQKAEQKVQEAEQKVQEAQERATQERQEKELAQERIEQLKAQLRALEVEPEQ
jgi:Uma2 family endonuclease